MGTLKMTFDKRYGLFSVHSWNILMVLTSMDKIIDQTKMPTKTVLLKINIISQMQQFYGIYINDVYLIQNLCTLFAYPLFPTFSKQTI